MHVDGAEVTYDLCAYSVDIDMDTKYRYRKRNRKPIFVSCKT